MNRTGKVLGGILVVLGALFLLRNLNMIGPFWHYINIGGIFHFVFKFWPLIFLVLPGVIFHTSFFSGQRRDAGLLVPGGILLVLGSAFQISMLFGCWNVMWPFFIFSVAFGLFELYAFGNQDRGLLIPIGILTGLSVIFFLGFSVNSLFSFNTRPFLIPLILIGIGLFVLFGGKGAGGRQKF